MKGFLVVLVFGIITCTGCGHEIVEDSKSPMAVPPPTMPSMERILFSFEASRYEISRGESSVLSWTTSPKCTRVEIAGIGEVAKNGSVEVTPGQTTTYCITADGPVRLPNGACLTIAVK
jgi:hypothetical protein